MLERGGSGRFGAVLVAVLAGCDAPREGQACQGARLHCASAGALLECAGGRWVASPCEGPAGCAETSSGVQCDTSVVTLGGRCAAASEGARRCAGPAPVVAECRTGAWLNVERCRGDCALDGGSAACLPPPSCGPATCLGCCAKGVCVGAPSNQSPGSCGTGGQACQVCGLHEACGPDGGCVATAPADCGFSTCNTCCAGNVCMAQSETTCGTLGRACSDCSSVDQLCERTTGRCVPMPTDGGAFSCGGVPSSGACLNTGEVQVCALATGQGLPSVVTYACPPGTGCREGAAGAVCAPLGYCLPGQSRCSGPTTLATCDVSLSWSTTSCQRGCEDGPVGAFCPAGATTPFSGTLLFERRRPNANYSAWLPAAAEPARGVLVVAQSATGAWYGVTRTDAAGRYTVNAPALPAGTDALLFIAWGGDGLMVTSAVMDAALGPGLFSVGSKNLARRTWSWSRSLSATPSGGTITITASQGSAALAIFEDLEAARAYDAARHQGHDGRSVVVWFGLGTRWRCGACFSNTPAEGFQTQVWLDGDATDQSYWSDAVTLHELGHWAMASFGRNPGEGGAHYFGEPTFPGQAWSEGFATFHSGALRDSPVYFDSQGGLFWFDLSTETFAGGGSFVEPTPSAGLMQRMDENALAAMLWRLRGPDAGTEQRLHDALASAHLTTAPWPRGYTRHTWSLCWTTSGNIEPCNVQDTHESAPMLADFLDALECGGLPAAALGGALRPDAGYPYPTAAPLCRPTLCYGCRDADGGACLGGLDDAACGTAGVACSACAAGRACAQGVCR